MVTPVGGGRAKAWHGPSAGPAHHHDSNFANRQACSACGRNWPQAGQERRAGVDARHVALRGTRGIGARRPLRRAHREGHAPQWLSVVTAFRSPGGGAYAGAKRRVDPGRSRTGRGASRTGRAPRQARGKGGSRSKLPIALSSPKQGCLHRFYSYIDLKLKLYTARSTTKRSADKEHKSGVVIE